MKLRKFFGLQTLKSSRQANEKREYILYLAYGKILFIGERLRK